MDIFETRSKANLNSGGGLSGDFGLLHAIDERLAAYGFETNTGVRFVVVVDMRGREAKGGMGGGGGVGLREGEMKVVSYTSVHFLPLDTSCPRREELSRTGSLYRKYGS